MFQKQSIPVQRPMLQASMTKRVSSYDVPPISTIAKKKSNRSRKRAKTCIVIRYPYKEELKQIVERTALNKSRKIVKDKWGARAKRKNPKNAKPTQKVKEERLARGVDSDEDIDDDSDDDKWAVSRGNKSSVDNASCIFWDGLFSDDVRGAVWWKVQC